MYSGPRDNFFKSRICAVIGSEPFVFDTPGVGGIISKKP